MAEREDYEKDFSGLEPYEVVEKIKRDTYLNAAKVCDVKMEYKTKANGRYEIWVPTEADLTEFWDHLNSLEG